jgi:hypothetical protein
MEKINYERRKMNDRGDLINKESGLTSTYKEDVTTNKEGLDESKLLEDTVEVYVVPYSIVYSIPVRVPGISLSLSCNPNENFQVTLKGGCDENGIFEMNQKPHTWKITPMHYAMGRLVYDVIWEEGLINHSPVHIESVYSTIIEEKQQFTLIPRKWEIDVYPFRWILLPKSKNLIKKIHVHLKRKFFANSTTFPPCEFKLAAAMIPLKIFDTKSTDGCLDLSEIQSHLIVDGKFNFSQVFNAWIVFEHDVDWDQFVAVVTYTVDTYA